MYIVYEDVPYEGGRILGVRSTLEACQRRAERYYGYALVWQVNELENGVFWVTDDRYDNECIIRPISLDEDTSITLGLR